jgi:arylformamidase
MKLIDLSHTLDNGMPVFPGDTAPVFNKVMTHAVDGAQVIRMEIATHHGTHLDCPLHFMERGESAGNAALTNFYGKALMVDCTRFGRKEQITAGHLSQASGWDDVSWVIIHTGWYKFWGSEKYFDHFPVLSTDAAEFLKEKKITGIGLDVISIDAIDSVDFPIHKIILGSGIYIIENLTNLHALQTSTFMLASFPLKIRDGDGSPLRAVALVDEHV